MLSIKDINTFGSTRYHIHIHESLRDASQFIADAPVTWSREASKANEPSRSWDLNAGFNGACELARNGWQDGANKLTETLASLPQQDYAPKKNWSVDGNALSVGRAMSGNPLCMRQKNKRSGQRKAMTLVASISANCDQDAQSMANYGLAVAAYVEQLERQSIPVEVIALWTSADYNDGIAVGWYVKQANELFNAADMAFSIGHPAALRRIGFALAERSTCPYMSGHGISETPKKALVERIEPQAVLLSGMLNANRHSQTPESAREYLSTEIAVQTGQ